MLNKTIIQGRLTKDPELRKTVSGVSVCLFTVAWSEKHKETEHKLFLRCVAWRNTADFSAKYFAKGQEVIAEGELVTRTWQDKEGNNRESVEMMVDRIHFCGSKKENQQTKNFNALLENADGFAEIDEEDGDLPF